MGAVYLFHDLYGYLMEMSADIAELVEAFADGAETEQIVERYRGRFEDADPRGFVDVLHAHAVLVEVDEDELDMIWAFVPLKGKWNIWHRRGERLTLWTAWGERPITQILLDADETAMWDAFDGEKRLSELRPRFDDGKLAALVRRLVHSDVQALKLTMMPWSMYAKRPGMAPPYLTSTMPYRPWKVGEPVPAAPDLSQYHQTTIVDADAQFDHQETTLSHLLRVPHPALNGRTYGQAIVDALDQRGLLLRPSAPRPGPLRVLEIGAGLGYVSRDVLARLREAGHEVSYTIVELSPALAAAQHRLIGNDATWVMGDVLAVELPTHGFDLVIANEMCGDLPARHLSRPELGLAIDGTGDVDLARLRTFGKGAELAAEHGVILTDAPEPFYLQTGAFELIAKLATWVAPGGSALVTEFGDNAAWPKLSTHLDHPELSTHFGQLVQLARALGLEAKVEFVIDFVDMDRTLSGLATTRSHFRALVALCEAEGVQLAKLGYTPALLDAALDGKLELATVGELRWDRIEDRLMGLVPHEFRALVLKA
jgi:SAM-dependent methyltransferase